MALSTLSKATFSEYLKFGLALKITKEGLHSIVEKETNDFHCNILREISGKQHCSECRIENILDCPTTGLCSPKHCSFHSPPLSQPRRCPNDSCNIIRDIIRENFRCYEQGVLEPSWSNTNAQLWTKNPFQVMKCYLPRSEYEAVGTLEDVDLNGLISIIRNNKRFDKIVSDDTKENNTIYFKLSEIEKYYRNCDNLTISDWKFSSHLKEMMIVLKRLHVTEAQQTVAKLKQIKSDTFTVNTQTISEVLSELILSITKEDEKKAMQKGKSKKRSLQKSPSKPSDRLNELHEYHEIFSRDNRNMKICQLETIISNQGETFYGPNKSAKKFKMADEVVDITLHKRMTTMQSLLSGNSYDQLKSDQEMPDWEHCFSRDTTFDRKFAERLIKSQNFPEQQALNKLFQQFGRKDELITTLCNKLGTFIKEKSKKIVQVIPSYFKDGDLCEKIIFVICTKGALSRKEKETIKKYPHKIRPVEYSLEGKRDIEKQLETKENLSFQDLQKLKKCINKHADTLFSKHKMLSIIAPSPVRFKLNGSEKPDKIPELCVVFYVHTKKYIPIEEEPFEKFYEGIPVDVREGCFMTHPANPVNHETLRNLEMGCNIGSEHCNKTGTLGGFIDHPTHGLCGITCAHVLLNDRFMDDLLRIGSIKWPNFHPNESVTQPGGTTNVMGRLVQADYKEGEGDQSGIEVALFQVERRHPHTGTFHGHDDMRFNSGKSYGLSRINDAPVVKIGSTTHETVGKFKMSSPAVSVRPLRYKSTGSLPLTLHNQLEVWPLPDSYAFSEPGDSGSLVFMKRSDEDNEYICVGMVEGGTDYGTTIVTPITSILQACGVDSFKSFETANLSKDLKNVETRITNTIDKRFSEVMDKLNERGNNVT